MSTSRSLKAARKSVLADHETDREETILRSQIRILKLEELNERVSAIEDVVAQFDAYGDFWCASSDCMQQGTGLINKSTYECCAKEYILKHGENMLSAREAVVHKSGMLKHIQKKSMALNLCFRPESQPATVSDNTATVIDTASITGWYPEPEAQDRYHAVPILELLSIPTQPSDEFHKQKVEKHRRVHEVMAKRDHFVVLKLMKLSSESQRVEYNKHMAKREFHQGDLVWLSIPTAGELDARWEGKWTVTSPKSPVAVEITDGARTRVVHVNRLRYRVQPEASPLMNTSHKQDWQPPQTDHLLVEETPSVLVEHAPPEDPGVEVSEEPNTMPGCLAEPDLPALEQVRPGESFAARYPTRIRHQTQRL
eukprot:Em0028g58a